MPTTKQIACAAGVAEGTIFRAFDTLEELRAAVLQHTFDPAHFLAALSLIDAGQPLRDLLIDIVTVLHRRLGATFTVMQALGLSAPPSQVVSQSADQIRADTASVLQHLMVGHEAELTLPVDEFVHIVRLLSFAGSHHEIAHGRTLTPEQTVDILLFGALRRPDDTAAPTEA
ncbi:MAG: TetR/AcrR family transcriptional regulator [Allobranchiibius sp.]